MTPTSPAEKTAKPKRGAPKKISQRRLENIAKFHIERFATTAANLKRVLLRRAERALRVHGGDRAECAGWVDEIVARFVRTGVVDDARYAMDRTASLRRLGKSPGKIRTLLRTKGVEQSLVEIALDASAVTVNGEDAAFTAAIAYARRRRLGPFGVQSEDAQEKRDKISKDLAALGRAGFSYVIAKRIAHAASADELI